MKLLFLILFSFPLFGQSFSNMFLPLQKGNFWKYEWIRYTGPNQTSSTYLYFKDIDDNYVIDNRVYHQIVLANTGENICFCRVNEEGYYVSRILTPSGYSIERKYYKKGLKPGDTLSIAPNEPIKTLLFTKEKDVFEKRISVSMFQEVGSAGIAFGEYTDEFGKISFEDDGYFEQDFIARGCLINGSVYGDTTMPTGVDNEITKSNSFALEQNYPNPFNPSTSIRYTLGQTGLVHLQVFDLLGNEVITLVNEVQTAGEHQVSFTARALPSGIYICRMQSGSQTLFRKMTLLK